jgi:hypothetical protein
VVRSRITPEKLLIALALASSGVSIGEDIVGGGTHFNGSGGSSLGGAGTAV